MSKNIHVEDVDMGELPKIVTLERVALKESIKFKDGSTYLYFPEDSEPQDPEKLDQVICNLQNGMFESEVDDKLLFDEQHKND